MSLTQEAYKQNQSRNRRTNRRIWIAFVILMLALSTWFITTTQTTFNCQRNALNNMAHDLHLAISGDKNKSDYREGPQTC